MRRLLSSVALLGALLAVTACAGPPPVGPAAVDYSTMPPTSTPHEDGPAPVRVRIPALHVESTLDALHLDDDQHLQVPPIDQPMQAGYFADGVMPGDPGPAVLAAHVNGRGPAGRSVPGLFAQLHTLQPGALIHVDRADGSTVTFRVTKVERYKKTQFDTAAVYGDTPGPELRLVTCHGRFLTDLHSYEDNLVVFATLV